MSAVLRLNVIQGHMTSKFPISPHDPSLDNYRKLSPFLNQTLLAKHYFGRSYSGLLSDRDLMCASPLFDHAESYDFSIESHRGRVVEQIKYLYSFQNITYPIDQADSLKKMALLYSLAEYSLSLTTRLGVHLVLYIDTLQNLGTEKHRQLIHDAYSLKDYGCFGMTELGHGSNVAEVETIASYDRATGGFILNSPTPTSAKWWIGAAANTANMAVIFAQLVVDGVNKGVHVFVIKIRDYDTHEVLEGVIIGDCGHKASLDGIDNGFILFKEYRIGYDCLLDRLSQIKAGKFKSSIKNKDKRLGVVLGGLIRGRLAVVSDSEINSRLCLTIALRYAAVRKQFGGAEEQPILGYQLHRYRLIPKLAQTLAMRCGNKLLFTLYDAVRPKADLDLECDELNELHSILSSVKVVCSAFGVQIAQECREACGGHGFSAYSAISRIRGYQDVHTTWEGDNSVLIQQTAKFILKVLQKSFKGQKIAPPSLRFLKFDFEEVKRYKCGFSKREELERSETLLELMEYRVNYMMHTSLLKLQENSMAASDMTEAWNNSQVFFVQDLARSFGELALAREFVSFSAGILEECKETGGVMMKFFYLFAIDRIVNSISCYLEGALNTIQEKIAKETIIKLSDELAMVSLAVVDALAPPDKILGSVIGAHDGQAYARMIKRVEENPKVYSQPNWLHLIKEIRKGS